MSYILDNIVQILVATGAGLLFGFLWYRTLGQHAGAVPLTGGRAAVAFVAEFWLASILAGALILAPPEAGEWVMAVGTPIVIWIGFVVPALVVTLGRMGTRGSVIVQEAGHWFGVMLVQALVLQLIGVSAPAAV